MMIILFRIYTWQLCWIAKDTSLSMGSLVCVCGGGRDSLPFNDTRFPGESFNSIRSELTLHLFSSAGRVPTTPRGGTTDADGVVGHGKKMNESHRVAEMGLVDGGEGVSRLIRTKRHNLTLLCVSSSFGFGRGIGAEGTFGYQCTRAIKINFNHFGETFLLQYLGFAGLLPNPDVIAPRGGNGRMDDWGELGMGCRWLEWGKETWERWILNLNGF